MDEKEDNRLGNVWKTSLECFDNNNVQNAHNENLHKIPLTRREEF